MKTINISLVYSLFLIPSFLSSTASGEVTLDGSMGTAGTLAGPDYQITEDLGQRTGSNLFHSFGQFNINSAESATFSGSAGIQNVISRVTGGQASTIDGAFRSTIPGANIYFLNPSGVIFGENASLDIQGSFHASTADYLRFKDGTKFKTGIAMANPVLTTAAPEAFGFLDNTPAKIEIFGGKNKLLEVPEGEILSLVGGDISIDNRAIYAPNGRVILASARAVGEVVMTDSSIDVSSLTRGGKIHINRTARNPTSPNNNMPIADIDVSGNSAGKVVIRGGEMVMNAASIWSATVDQRGEGVDIGLTGALTMNGGVIPQRGMRTNSISTNTFGEGEAGNITVHAESILIDNNNSTPPGLTSGSYLKNEEGGNAGDITLTATNSVEVLGGSINTSTFGKGDGGNLNIYAGSILLDGNTSELGTILTSASHSPGIRGNAGDLSLVTTGSFEMRSGAIVGTSTFSQGHAGNIAVSANSILIDGSHSSLPTGIISTSFSKEDGGNAGEIAFTATDSFKALNGALIGTDTYGKGKGGDLAIHAESILIEGSPLEPTILSTTSRSEHAGGNAGDLTLATTGSISINENGIIRTNTFGKGDGGSLNVSAESLLIDGSNSTVTGIISVSHSKGVGGNAGDMTFNITDSFKIRDKGTIGSISEGKGHAGDIAVYADSILIDGSDSKFSGISSQSNSKGAGGDAGNIIFDTSGSLIIRDGGLVVTATLGKGQGGDLSVRAGSILIDDNNSIFGSGLTTGSYSENIGGGDAGNLMINADHIKIHNGAITTETYGSGLGGDLAITSKTILLENKGTIQSQSKSYNNNAGKSGNMTISADERVQLTNDSSFSVSTNNASAGEIKISSGKLIQLSNSKITTSVANGKGAGGNISLNTPIVALDKSKVIANAAKGNGGGINISGFRFESPNSVVEASSEEGIGGKINLSKPDTDISGSIAVLPVSLLNVSDHLSDDCSSRTNKNTNSFIIKTSGGIPISPGKVTPSSFLDYSTTTSLPLKNRGSVNKSHYPLNSLVVDCNS